MCVYLFRHTGIKSQQRDSNPRVFSDPEYKSGAIDHYATLAFFGGSSPPIITLIRFLVRSDVGSTMTAYFRSQHQQMSYWISVMVINQSIYFLIKRTPQRYIIFFNFPNFEIKFLSQIYLSSFPQHRQVDCEPNYFRVYFQRSH